MERVSLLFKIFWAPRETLREVAKRPVILAPLLLLTVFAGVETAVVFSKLDPGELRIRQFERAGYADKIPAADKALFAQNARKNRWVAAALTVVRSLIVIPCIAGFLYLCFGVGRGVSFPALLAIAAFAFVPTIIRSPLTVGTILLSEPTLETLTAAGAIGPIRLVDATAISPEASLALSLIDVISFWILALLVIGCGYALQGRARLIARIPAVLVAYVAGNIVYGALLVFLV